MLKTSALLLTYYYVAMFSTILFVLKLILFNLGAGTSEVVSDFNTEFDSDPSFSFISVQSVMAFLMGFGWMGYAGVKQFGFNGLTSLIVAFSVGLIFMVIVSLLMSLVRKLEENKVSDNSDALNRKGKAYTAFAPHGIGQIEIEVNGKLSVVEARNNSDEEIKSFEMIQVKKIEENILYIEKI